MCCVALYCAKAEGFPYDKQAGDPCKNLDANLRCTVYSELAKQKLKGCIAYDCLGAGQKVVQTIYGQTTWKASPETARQMFDVFLIVFHLHQMLWYLAEASTIKYARQLHESIVDLINKNQEMTRSSPDEILAMNIGAYKHQADNILRKASELVQLSINSSIDDKHTSDFIGKDFMKADLSGKDFSLSLLIAADFRGCNLYGANFLGADMREANIEDTDLSQSIFLTQMQINSAKGNCGTKLPPMLSYPASWSI